MGVPLRCYQGRNRRVCKEHKKCKILYRQAPKILWLLFNNVTGKLKLDLQRINPNLHEDTINVIFEVIEYYKKMPNLRSLEICSESVVSDTILHKIERFSPNLVVALPNLEVLQLPVVSNYVLKKVSYFPNLKYFTSDTSNRMIDQGLYHLCHPKADTRRNLISLHIGLYKNTYRGCFTWSGFF